MASPIAANEALRQDYLNSYQILDTPFEIEFNDIVQLASSACAVDVSLVDADRQWFKAQIGLDDVRQTAREDSFCANV